MIDAAIVRVLLEASLRVCFVALAVAVVLKVARVQSSSVRHAAWTSVVIAMLLMPALPYVVPSFELPGRSRLASSVASIPDELPYVGDVQLTEMLPGPIVEPLPVSNDLRVDAATAAQPQTTSWPTMPLWLVAAMLIYAVGLAMLLIRWFLAARFIAKLRRHSTPIASVAAGVFESPLAATPITVGALTPWIVLPTDWKTWSHQKLAGVLAHELAHVERRDPMIALVAYVNRCIFWFHPLAWWLERKLAATAEDAADDAGARAMGEQREYAAVLVEMATVVHRHGGRVAWQGVGVDGNGLLGQRIDRLLSGQIFGEVSRMKKLLIAAACIGAVFVAVACRTEPPPLKPDPAVAERLAANRSFKTGDELRAEAQAQLVQLRATLDANPNDMDALKKLLTAYSLDFSGKPNPHAAEYTEARRPYILRLIKEHPESQLAGSWLARMYPSPREPLQDPLGYAEGRALWSEHIRRPNASAAALVNAASWLESYDKPLAEEALLRLAKLDAKTASSRRGALYALALVGANASMPIGVVRSNDAPEAQSAFAASVRRTLAQTKDVALLSSTCLTLFRVASSATGLDFDPLEAAVGYCDRTLALDPANEGATLVRNSVAERAEYLRQRDVLKGVDRTQRFAVISKLPESEQLPVLGRLAASSWFAAVDFEYNKHDQAAADPQWKQARQFADAAVALSTKMRDRPEAGEQMYQAKIVMAALALHDGSRQGAVRWLTEAAEVPRTKPEAPMNSVEDAVVHHLLQAGERQSIINFYDKVAALPGRTQEYARKSAASLRAGTMPMRYQYSLDWAARTAAKAK